MPQARDAPRGAYDERIADRNRTLAAERGLESRLSYARLGLFVSGLILAWLALAANRLHWGWVVLVGAAFVALLLFHERVIKRRRRTERAVAFYRRGLARLDDRWAGHGTRGEEFLDPEHPYAADLDLFGPGSLFELLCAARTPSGERLLARWLLEPAAPAEIRRRHAAIDELRPMLDLREELAVEGEAVGKGVDPDKLIGWGGAQTVLQSQWPVALAALLAVVNYATLLAFLVSQLGTELGTWSGPLIGPKPLAISVALSLLFWFCFRRRAERVLGAVEEPERELELLARIVERLEGRRFESPLLTEIRNALDSDGHLPSKRIARLARLVELNASRANMLFRPFADLMLLGTQLAFAMERWRAESGPRLAAWLDTVGRIEALSSLAGFAYENPDDRFPELLADGPCFEGRGLGHPLIPEESSVRNDIALGERLQVLIVSGSNMSGKSTLLRTVGVNAVLALAGAPVRARKLRLSPLAIGACMRVHDSLQQGLSRFYAEIQRLSRVVEIGRQPTPLLFLFDEILHGTNSHDRRIGAAALIGGLVERGSVGLVTTHDLALAGIADDLAPLVSNVHFEDRIEGDEIRFDYTLRDGVVRKSNALELMRLVGLEV